MYSARAKTTASHAAQRAPSSQVDSQPVLNLQPAIDSPQQAGPDDILALQRAAGNQAVAGLLENAPRGDGELSPAFSTAVQRMRGSGLPLPPGLRQELESSLPGDLSRVRLHTGEQADALNRQVGARAFTIGADIFFSQGAFSPHTSEGRRTLRHELAHVAQQNGRSTPPQRLGLAHDLHEQAAERFGQGLAQPLQAAPATGGSVQRTGKLDQDIPAPSEIIKEGYVREDSSMARGTLNTGRVHAAFFRHPDRPVDEDADWAEDEIGYYKINLPAAEELNPSTQAARSVASSRMDQWLGFDVLAHEHFYENGKDPGGISEKVRGVPMHKAKNVDYSNAVTQKGLADMQLLDAISGQHDRHPGNIFIDPATGRVKGIDNEMAFGAADQKKITDLPQSYKDPRALQTMAQLGGAGGNEWYTGLPSHVDIGSAKSILSHKAGDMGKVLNSPGAQQGLSDEEISEAQARYKVMKRYIKSGMAGQEDLPQQLMGLGMDAETAASKAESWKTKYGNLGGPAPKIVRNWDKKTYQEQTVPRSNKWGKVKSTANGRWGHVPRELDTSYLQLGEKLQDPSRFKFALVDTNARQQGFLRGTTHSQMGKALSPGAQIDPVAEEAAKQKKEKEAQEAALRAQQAKEKEKAEMAERIAEMKAIMARKAQQQASPQPPAGAPEKRKKKFW